MTQELPVSLKVTSDTADAAMGEDQADFVLAVFGILMALEAVKKDLPEPIAQSVSSATDGVVNALGRFMARHNIDIKVAMAVQQPVQR